jgi:LysM repeat protein
VCPAGRHPESAALLHPPALVPMAPLAPSASECARAWQKFSGKYRGRQIGRPCQKKPAMPKSRSMKRTIVPVCAIMVMMTPALPVHAQAMAKSPTSPAVEARLDALAKKMDEQNLKIDLLSQQILKLQQQLTGNSVSTGTATGSNSGNGRPGVMIGEGAPSTPTSASAPSSAAASPASPGGTSHIVARGETLTSIAKANSVSVSDLQKYNHIDNPLKLQAGQTIMIPPPPSSSPNGE